MNTHLFDKFLASSDTLRVYRDNKLLFASGKDGLLPILEYIDRFVTCEKDVTIFDRITGNAAALLLKKVFCQDIYSPLGSELAARTLSNYGIRYQFTEIVPYIQNCTREDMCPMEELSRGKSPEEFYEAVRTFALTSQVKNEEEG